MSGRTPQFVGVDLASQPEKSSLCVIEWVGKPRITDLVRPATDDAIVERARDADAIGIDCPLGWPTPFVEMIRRHHEGTATSGIDADPRDLRLRTTDQWLRRHHTPRDPLSVSTDRLGIVALRGIGILERLVGPGADRSGADGVYEAYPAGSLAVWGLRSTGYKSTGRNDGAAVEARAEIVTALAPHIDLGSWSERLVDNADDLDAVVTAIVAGLGHAGLSTAAPPEHRKVATIEGWIHVPTVPLDALPAAPGH